jgi:nicotinate-nucleotide--dimethylbenzimidazole phosphoribosyltransferase
MTYLSETVTQIRPLDSAIAEIARRHLDALTKPRGSLGRLEELGRRLAVIQGQVPPRLGRKLLFVFASDHGITEEGVSAYPKEVTAQMTRNLLNGTAAVNIMARQHGIETVVVDIGVDADLASISALRHLKLHRGTRNFALEPAMTRADALRSVELGIRLVRDIAGERHFLMGSGEMGIGNTSSAAAILCALTGTSPATAAGRGTGIDDLTLARKISAIEAGLRLNQPDPNDPLDVLAKVGGFEIGAIAGVMLEAARARIPMVLDGFVTGAAALLAHRLCPSVTDVFFASHLSAEPGHRIMLDTLRLTPFLDLGMRLGEGTGACLLMGLLETAARLMCEMATFEGSGVSSKFR